MDIDPKRSGVKASLQAWGEPTFHLLDCGQERQRWFGPPGAFAHLSIKDGQISYALACPGCGQLGGPNKGANWTVEAGSIEDPLTLTLRPSIAKSCCGWHGYLTDGVFNSC